MDMQITPHETEPFSQDLDLDMRHIWATFRSWMEIDNHKRLRKGGKRKRHWDLLERLLEVFGFGLKVIGLYNRGLQNSYDIKLNEFTLYFDDLPNDFDQYTILHLTDLHFDSLPEIEKKIGSLVQGLEIDLCVMTGDYRHDVHGQFRHVLEPMNTVIEALSVKDGIVATLGNHDTVFMVSGMEELGIRVLANETVTIQRGEDKIHITGIDDVHYYYTDMVYEAFDNGPEGFKIALVHSPEIYDMAEEYGYRFYLAGHTHGGQICLPGGKPLIVHCNNGRHLSQGLWSHGRLTGYTSTGASTSAIPIRFYSRGEITLFTLKRGGK